MKLFALAAGVLGVPIENDYVPAPMVIGGTQVCYWLTNQKKIFLVIDFQNFNFLLKSQSF